MDFQDVKRVVGDAAQKVVQKSGEAVEYTKLKYKIFDIQNDINKIFTRMGRDVYASYNGGNVEDADIEKNCQLIDEKKSEIEALEEKLAELKNKNKA